MELKESIKENQELINQLGSQCNDIKIINSLVLVTYDKEVSNNIFASVVNDTNEIYGIVGYEIENVGEEPIYNIKYVDKDYSIKEKTLQPNERMFIQTSFLTLLLTRPEYSFKVLENQLQSDNNEYTNLDALFSSYYFIENVPQKKIGLYNVVTNEHTLLEEFANQFLPIYYVGNKDIAITAKTAQLVAQLIS